MMIVDLRHVNKYCAVVAIVFNLVTLRKMLQGRIEHDRNLAQHFENKIIKNKFFPEAAIGKILQKALKSRQLYAQ